MIDRFTQKAREAIRLAVETAEELEHGYVGTEHLLLGLIKEGSGVAAAILERYDVTEDKILELMERLISPAVPTRTADQAEYTPGARAVLQASYEEAVFFKAPLIGTEHILIAMIKEGKCTASRLLNTMNVNIQKLYVDLMAAMGDDVPAGLFAGFVVAMAGVFLVIFNGQFTLQLKFTGDLLAMAAALSWAFYTILLKKESAQYNSVFLTRKVFFYAMLTMTPLMATDQFAFAHLALLGRMEVLLPLLFLGLVCSTACYVCWNQVVAHLGAVKANNFVYLNPLVAMVVSVLFLHETITVYMLIGAGLILGGVMISEKKPRKPRAVSSLPSTSSHS